ncbi:MAG TPA: hypothetical protein VND64_07500 [Pirellulales bacterium]|nr:hypothetical protein [Pirellulales bacterium]
MKAETKIIIDAIDRLTNEVRQLRISLFPEAQAETQRQSAPEIVDTTFSKPLGFEEMVLGG